MGGKGKKKRKGKKGKGGGGGRGGPTPGAASWRWGDGGGEGTVAARKYGALGPEAVELQLQALANEMGLECDSAPPSKPAEERQTVHIHRSAKSAKRSANDDDDDGEDGQPSPEVTRRPKTKAKLSPHSEDSEVVTESAAERLQKPGTLCELKLEAEDVQEAPGRAAKKAAALWGQLKRCGRLVRAARLTVGHPLGRPDTALCLELLRLLSAWLHPIVGHRSMEDLLNARTCISAIQQACASVEHLQNAIENMTVVEGRTAVGRDLPEGAASSWVALVCSLDELFFQIHYAERVAGPKGAEVFSPAEYLEAVAPAGGLPSLLAGLAGEAERRELSEGMRQLMGEAALSEVQSSISSSNDLLRIYWARCLEGAALFLHSGLAATLASKAKKEAWFSSTAARNGKKKKQGKLQRTPSSGPGPRMAPPLTPSILQSWRDAARDWVARLYTFAVPTSEALSAIAALGVEVVEIGAGAGYWAMLMRKAGIAVKAYDVAPPSTDGKWNDYHGQVPAFTEVQRGGPEVMRLHPQAALLLCFPPPGEDMASRCLESHSGDTVIHIGEWGGQTGDETFEKMLLLDFEVSQVVQLPNYGNTHYSLSIWSRRDPNRSDGSSGLGILSCSQCGGAVQDRTAARRSRLCHQLVYCSDACCDGDEEGRRQLMTACLLPVEHRAEHFVPLPVGDL